MKFLILILVLAISIQPLQAGPCDMDMEKSQETSHQWIVLMMGIAIVVILTILVRSLDVKVRCIAARVTCSSRHCQVFTNSTQTG